MMPVEQGRPGLAERCFTIIALIYFSKAMVSLLNFGGAYDPRAGSFGFQVIGASIYLVTFGLIFLRFRLFLQLCLQNKALLLLVGFAVLSYFWSIDAGITFRRVVALVATTAFGVYLVMRFTPEEYCRLLALTLAILAVLSLVFVVALPQIGTHVADVHAGTWRGVFPHKNGLGRMMGLATVVFLAIALQGGRHRQLAWVGAVLCAFLLAMSESRTGWLLAGCTLSILIVLKVFQKTHRTVAIPGLILGGLVLAGGAFWALANLDTATALIGRNATLTGRTDIWSVLIEQADSDWLGYGYQAFWYSPLGERFVLLWFGKDLGSAHNGYLELWLDLGYVGVALFLILIFTSLYRLTRGLLNSREGYSLLLPTILLFSLISSIPTVLLEENSVLWIIFVATLFSIYEPRVLIDTTHRQRAWKTIMTGKIEA